LASNDTPQKRHAALDATRATKTLSPEDYNGAGDVMKKIALELPEADSHNAGIPKSSPQDDVTHQDRQHITSGQVTNG
jgi:hypothetical protein